MKERKFKVFDIANAIREQIVRETHDEMILDEFVDEATLMKSQQSLLELYVEQTQIKSRYDEGYIFLLIEVI